MKSTSVWTGGYKSKVDNGRGHEAVVDLPQNQGGDDVGATALELALMGLSGCITTIFVLIAQKSRLEFEALEAEINATKGERTIETADVIIKIKTSDPKKADRVLNQTLETCPVGILFADAGVKISHKLIVE